MFGPVADPASRSWRALARHLVRFSGRHLRAFWLGWLAALIFIGFRLALPWLGSRIVVPWLAGRGGGDAGHALALGALRGFDSPLAIGGLFLLLCVGLGFADYLMRVYFARFSIGVARDLRAAAFHSAVAAGQAGGKTLRPGDIANRLVGDTARLKTGIKTVLIHVAANLLLFAGVIAVLLWIDLTLGAIFAVAFALVAAGTARGAASLYRRALRLRTKEGRMVDAIDGALRDGAVARAARRVRRSEGASEASLTRTQARTTLWAYAVFGAGIAAAAWFGLRSVSAGRLAAHDMITFVLYAFMMRNPLVKLARQGARTGKIFASCHRVVDLLEAAPAAPVVREVGTDTTLRLADLELHSSRRTGRRHLLGPVDLVVPPAQHLALVGEPGAGKSLLCQVIAGLRPPRGGTVVWGDGSPAPAVAYLPHQPTWRRQPVRDYLGLPPGPPDRASSALLDACGAGGVIARLPGGLDAAVASTDVSSTEARTLAMARVLLGSERFVVLDDPVAGLDRPSGRKIMRAFLEARRDTTVIVASAAPVAVERFDRVVEVWRGRVVFDGSPQAWQASSANDRDSRVFWN